MRAASLIPGIKVNKIPKISDRIGAFSVILSCSRRVGRFDPASNSTQTVHIRMMEGIAVMEI